MIAALAAACSLLAWTVTGWGPDERLWMRRHLDDLGFRIACAAKIARERLARTPMAKKVQGTMPAATLSEASEMIDVIRLGLSAGLSFDAALDVYCENRSSALALRMAEAKASWQMGLSGREDALRSVADDVGLRVLESFAATVGQALSLGAPLAETLAGMSREIRAAHRSEVERRIERTPVKLLIPTGTLTLPALLLSILGPLLAAGGMM